MAESARTSLFHRHHRWLALAVFAFGAAACGGADVDLESVSTTVAVSAPVATDSPETSAPGTVTVETVVPETVPAETAPETTPTPTTAGEGPYNVFTVPIGVCFNQNGSSELDVVDCTEPHTGQKLADVPLQFDGAYSAAEAKDITDPQCRTAFEAFVGTDYDVSELFYIGITPGSDAFAELGYGAACVIGPESGTIDFDAEGAEI